MKAHTFDAAFRYGIGTIYIDIQNPLFLNVASAHKPIIIYWHRF